LRAALAEAVPERAVGQLGGDDELAVDDVVTFEGEDVGMADLLDAAEGLELLLGAVALIRIHAGAGAKLAIDELHRLQHTAGRLGLPDLAEAAAAKPLDQSVPRDRF